VTLEFSFFSCSQLLFFFHLMRRRSFSSPLFLPQCLSKCLTADYVAHSHFSSNKPSSPSHPFVRMSHQPVRSSPSFRLSSRSSPPCNRTWRRYNRAVAVLIWNCLPDRVLFVPRHLGSRLVFFKLFSQFPPTSPSAPGPRSYTAPPLSSK